jgi:hypothetical protein
MAKRIIRYTNCAVNFKFVVSADTTDYKEYPWINTMFLADEDHDEVLSPKAKDIIAEDKSEPTDIILLTNSIIFDLDLHPYWEKYFNFHKDKNIFEYHCAYPLISLLWVLECYCRVTGIKQNCKKEPIHVSDFKNPLLWKATYELSDELQFDKSKISLMLYFEQIKSADHTVLYNQFIADMCGFQVYLQDLGSNSVKCEKKEFGNPYNGGEPNRNAYLSIYDMQTKRGCCPIISGYISTQLNYGSDEKKIAERDKKLYDVCTEFVEFHKKYVEHNLHQVRLTIGCQMYVLMKKHVVSNEWLKYYGFVTTFLVNIS